jgi:hypothetical protein
LADGSAAPVSAPYGFREFVDAGGLMAYGSDLPGQYRLAAGVC